MMGSGDSRIKKVVGPLKILQGGKFCREYEALLAAPQLRACHLG